jgi:hypothetical protein
MKKPKASEFYVAASRLMAKGKEVSDEDETTEEQAEQAIEK